MKRKHKKDRKVKKGIDYEKITRIWNTLVEAGNWLHIAEISRRTGINECTVRWYLDKYLQIAIDEEKVLPRSIKLRLVKLKPNIELKNVLKAQEKIKEIRSEMKQPISSAFTRK